MEPTPGERAMGIPEIIRTICRFLPVRDLENARLVSKTWNKEANWWFHRRAIVNLLQFRLPSRTPLCWLALLESFLLEESDLQNQNLVATVPCAVDIGQEDLKLLLKCIQTGEPALQRIKIIHFDSCSPRDLDSCLSYVLHHLPWLEVLGLSVDDEINASLGPDGDFSVTGFKSLSLTKLQILDFSTDVSLDFSFVNHCKNLKTLEFCLTSSEHVQSFRDACQMKAPTFRYEHVKIDLTEFEERSWDAMINYMVSLRELFEVIQPQEIMLSISSSTEARVLHEAAKTASSVTRLDVSLEDFSFADMVVWKEAISNLKSFSGLRELCIRVDDNDERMFEQRYDQISYDSHVKGFFKNIHKIGGLTKLEVIVTSDSWRMDKEKPLIALFYGFKPRVPLNVIKVTWQKQEFEFSLEEFNRAMKEAKLKIIAE